MERDSLVAEDVVVNTFTFMQDFQGDFQLDADFLAGAADIRTRLQTFYNSLVGYFSSVLTGNAKAKFYALADPKPRAPKIEYVTTVPVATTAWPSEVAMCLSFRGDLVSGVNPRRRRGRIFIGPLSTGTSSPPTTGSPDVRPALNVRQAVVDAAELMAMGTTAAAPRLAVYSPTNDVAGTLQSALTPVSHFWMDDAFDTQRRRGAAPTSRVTKTVIVPA
jgi:hypothetical protein